MGEMVDRLMIALERAMKLEETAKRVGGPYEKHEVTNARTKLRAGAIAVLQEIQEPSAAMKAAAGDAVTKGQEPPDASEYWEAMTRAALEKSDT